MKLLPYYRYMVEVHEKCIEMSKEIRRVKGHKDVSKAVENLQKYRTLSRLKLKEIQNECTRGE